MPVSALINRRPERIAVFLGPSCARERARECLAAEYFPPACRGDLRAAVQQGYGTIVLIDGYIVTRYSPSPQEVSDVLSAGAAVFGAASVGALRAVELRTLGMVGVGWVYGEFLSGRLDRDDELVSTMDPDNGHRSISIPLVRIRYAATSLIARARITATTGATLIDRLSADYFASRTASRVLSHAREIGIDAETAHELLSPAFDVKALDTMACLRAADLARDSSLASSGIAGR